METEILRHYRVPKSKEEMLDRTFQDITHPDDLQADLDQMQKLNWLVKSKAFTWKNDTFEKTVKSFG